ncbi:MAG TPA: hypothetical protein VIV60_16870 [Polyangiaceae bacterium]
MPTFASLQRRQPLRTRQQQEKTKATVAVKKRSVGPVPNVVNWTFGARPATAQPASSTVALSSPGDAAEHEADQLASRMTRLTTADVDVTSTNSRGTTGHDDWSAFMAARPEIQRATLDLFESLIPQFAGGGPTRSEWSGGWKAFNSVMTGVRLNVQQRDSAVDVGACPLLRG